MPFCVYVPLNDAFLFRNKEYKVLFGPPPPQRLRDTSRSRYCWIFTYSSLSDSAPVNLQSNPFIEFFYLIIVGFSRPHFSIYDIFIQKKTHKVSTQGPLALIQIHMYLFVICMYSKEYSYNQMSHTIINKAQYPSEYHSKKITSNLFKLKLGLSITVKVKIEYNIHVPCHKTSIELTKHRQFKH